MSNGQLTKEQFQALPVSQKLDWIFETLAPMSNDYNSYQMLKRFGLGLGTLIVTVSGVGTGIIFLVNLIRNHLH